MQDIIKQPILTEKSNMLSEKNNTYTFIVDRNSNKIEIKNAIEKLYNVAVDSVNTMNYGGGKRKMKQTSRGISFQRNKLFKKAVVRVAEGDIIDLYENI